MKKVSIVTPVYRVEKYIADCMESVINQTYSNIEFILVDDCGGDRSVEIMEQVIAATHKAGLEFKLLHHKCNQGVAAARSHAMQAATGDYIFCLDSDDKLEPECIEHLVKRMEETDADFVVCGHYSDNENAGLGGHLCAPVDMLNSNEECIHGLAASWFNVAPWCKLLKRSFIEKHQLYFRDGIINEDAPWTFQLCLNANKIAFLNEDLYYYRYNDSSIMSSSKKNIVCYSNEIILDMFHKEIVNRQELWNNYDVYILMMREIIIYYTILAKHCGIITFFKKICDLKKYKYKSVWFTGRRVPPTYRIWNICFVIPPLLSGVLTYCLIKIQNR